MAKMISIVLLSLLLACVSATWQQEGQQEGFSDNPYVFEERHFFTGMQSQHGRVRVLPKFTDRSPLLRGIENYRVTIFEAEPQTFVLPNHWDADAVFFVANGRGTVSIARQENRESFNIKQGDVVRIKAGTSAYLVNQDNKQRLVLAKLLVPINTPGEFQAFFGAGGGNPESFYSVFSKEILQAALNTAIDKIQSLFGQQQQGFIIKASEEQIRALSQHEEGGIWPFKGGESSRAKFNLYEQHPKHANQYGQLYEVDSNQFRQLHDLDLQVSLANITQGAMTAPFYNSKATKIAIVVDGEGYFEMACPHLSEQQGGQQWQGSRQEQQGGRQGREEWQGRQGQQGGRQGSQEWQGSRQEQQEGGRQGREEWQGRPGQQGGRQGSQEQQGGRQGSQEWQGQQGSRQGQQGGYQGSQGQQGGRQWQGGQQGSQEQQQQQGGPRYQRISSRLRVGTVVVVPAGHPFVAVASNNQNLQLLCFEVNAQDNEKFTLAGKRNVISQLEREAKELSFGVPARLVDEVFRSQEEVFFFQGPRQQSQGRAAA